MMRTNRSFVPEIIFIPRRPFEKGMRRIGSAEQQQLVVRMTAAERTGLYRAVTTNERGVIFLSFSHVM